MQGETLFFQGDQYREPAYGTVYFVAGTETPVLNDFVQNQAEFITAQLNRDESNWVTCSIVFLDAGNTFFTPREKAVLYSALLPSDDQPEDQYGFFAAEFDVRSQEEANAFFARYFHRLLDLFDEVLDNCRCEETYPEEDYAAPMADFGAPGACMAEAAIPDIRADKCASRARIPIIEYSKKESAPRHYAPSRLEITPFTYDVLLPDYKREIHFTAQVKALYVLFLNHPEGIRMKEIADYKEEYKQVYFHVTNRSDEEQLRRAVDRLIDVCNPNALNVKKSQCNEALQRAIPESDLRSYYEIEVNRGQPHRIRLDRSLVFLPEDLRP